MSVFLVRHAETDANAARIVQTPDAPLSARGREQAERLARRLAADGVAAIVSSDLRRAVETAEALRRAIGAGLTLDAGLRERDYGDVRGTPYALLRADIFAPDYEPPGGETWAAFHARVDAAWARVAALAERTAGNLAVVTHGLVCRAVVERHLTLPAGVAAQLARANTAVTIVDGVPPRVVRLLDCAAHLDGVVRGEAV
jgi:probable phosphoglycerate mutase